MSEGEKKAIKELKEIKELVEEDLKNEKYEVTATLDRIDLKSLVIVLNLLEELKEKNKELDKENQGLFELYNFNDSSLLSKILKDYKKIIDKQQKEIKKEKSRIMELAELLDKQDNEINSLQQELEIQEGCSISKDKIREKIKKAKEINWQIPKLVIEYFEELLEED